MVTLHSDQFFWLFQFASFCWFLDGYHIYRFHQISMMINKCWFNTKKYLLQMNKVALIPRISVLLLWHSFVETWFEQTSCFRYCYYHTVFEKDNNVTLTILQIRKQITMSLVRWRVKSVHALHFPISYFPILCLNTKCDTQLPEEISFNSNTGKCGAEKLNYVERGSIQTI